MTTTTTTTTTQSWLLGPGRPVDTPSVPDGVEYHRVLAGEKRRVGRGILAILLLVAGFIVFPTVIGRTLALVDVQMGKTPESIALAKELRKRGFAFFGPTTAYAFMQAMGLVNDHLEGCITRARVTQARARFVVPG